MIKIQNLHHQFFFYCIQILLIKLNIFLSSAYKKLNTQVIFGKKIFQLKCIYIKIVFEVLQSNEKNRKDQGCVNEYSALPKWRFQVEATTRELTCQRTKKKVLFEMLGSPESQPLDLIYIFAQLFLGERTGGHFADILYYNML